MPSVQIEIPFEGNQPLVLDPISVGDRHTHELNWLFNHSDESELPRILTSAVILWHAKAGTIGECLSTAIIWERG